MQAGTLPPETADQTDGNEDGCYINFATAEGCGALNGPIAFTGVANTAIGWRSLFFSGGASANTGVGAGTLALNTGDENTATGAGALLISGFVTPAFGNTADGAFTLFQNQNAQFNTAVGVQALENNDLSAAGTANNNTAVGAFALGVNIDAFNNTAVGGDALFFNDLLGIALGGGIANNNTAVGWEAMEENVNAARNTAVGAFALQNNDFFGFDLSTDNTAVGFAALRFNIDAFGNTALGSGALELNDFFELALTALNNTAVGLDALGFNQVADGSTAVGTNALLLNDIDAAGAANNNTAVGSFALLNNVDGTNNNAVGADALLANDGTLFAGAGSSNNAFGTDALFFNSQATDNTAIGDLAMAFNDITAPGVASFNAAVGSQALLFNDSGSDNAAVGFATMSGNLTGFQNVAMGSQALGAAPTGISSFNVALGFQAELLDDGAFNTVVGYQAGFNTTTGPTTSFENIYIGDTAGNLDLNGNDVPVNEVLTTRIGSVFTEAFSPAAQCFIGGIRTNFQPIVAGVVQQVTIDLTTGRLGWDAGPNQSAPSVPSGAPPARSAPQPRSRPQPATRPSAQHQAMLNDKVEKLEATVAQQQQQIATLTNVLIQQAAQIQKVSAQVEMMKPAPRVVENR